MNYLRIFLAKVNQDQLESAAPGARGITPSLSSPNLKPTPLIEY